MIEKICVVCVVGWWGGENCGVKVVVNVDWVFGWVCMVCVLFGYRWCVEGVVGWVLECDGDFGYVDELVVCG